MVAVTVDADFDFVLWREVLGCIKVELVAARQDCVRIRRYDISVTVDYTGLFVLPGLHKVVWAVILIGLEGDGEGDGLDDGPDVDVMSVGWSGQMWQIGDAVRFLVMPIVSACDRHSHVPDALVGGVVTLKEVFRIAMDLELSVFIASRVNAHELFESFVEVPVPRASSEVVSVEPIVGRAIVGASDVVAVAEVVDGDGLRVRHRVDDTRSAVNDLGSHLAEVSSDANVACAVGGVGVVVANVIVEHRVDDITCTFWIGSGCAGQYGAIRVDCLDHIVDHEFVVSTSDERVEGRPRTGIGPVEFSSHTIIKEPLGVCVDRISLVPHMADISIYMWLMNV